MLREIRAAGIKRYTGCTELKAVGDKTLEGIEFSHRNQHHRLDCEHLFLHQGVVADTRLARSMRLPHHWNERQQCFQTTVDATGCTANPIYLVAGDGGAINGAIAAEIQGRIAALNCCRQQQLVDPRIFDTRYQTLQKQLRTETASRAFLDILYQPAEQFSMPTDETIICRCESVTVADIKSSIAAGASGPNQAKAFTRCGMGPCQGRYCELSVTRLICKLKNQTPEDTGGYRIRAPLKPVTVAELASLHQAD